MTTAAPKPPVLVVDDLSVTFASDAGTVQAVRSLSYEVAAGEVFGIVGESGSGKSVSSLAIIDLLPPSARVTGSVLFRGQQLRGLPDAELSRIRGRAISMIFQDPLSALTPVYTVGDQIAEAIVIHEGTGKRDAAERAVQLLDMVGIPNPRQRATAFPHEFSGGMRQRVMIAMAIANNPDLIIADEPTTALDVTVQAQILDLLLKARQATGAAIIMITHDLGIIAGMADRVGVMYAGRMVEMGTADDIFHAPRMPYTMGLLASIPRLDRGRRQRLTPIEGSPPSLMNLPTGCVFHPRCPIRIERCLTDVPALLAAGGSAIHMAACHRSSEIEAGNLSAQDIYPQADTPVDRRREKDTGRAIVIQVRDLVKTFPVKKGTVLRRTVGSVHAVDGISFQIREGETLGLVGESGCGKTTTIIEIMNLHKPEGGSIMVFGKETTLLARSDRFAVRRKLSIVFQDPMASLDPRMPIGDILAEPMLTHGMGRREIAERVSELLRIVGLEAEHANRYPQAFSGGQRQRISIARALALEPKVVVLDEPVSALDVSIRAGIINLLEDLREMQGLAYLFVAHDLSVVRHIADRVAVMYLGRITEMGAVEEVFRSPCHPYTQALLSAIPVPDPRVERQRGRILLEGDLPGPMERVTGCRFRSRCPRFARELSDSERQKCIDEDPVLLQRAGAGDHMDACHYSAPKTVV